MNPKVPPAIAYLKANPTAPIYDVAIDFGVSNSTLRHAWAKIREAPGKAGRPKSERVMQAVALYKSTPGLTQVAVAKQCKITPSHLSRELKKTAVKCAHCGGVIHG